MAPDRNFTLLDRQLSLVRSFYWVNFVKTGNPNGAGLSAWNPMETDQPTVLEFGAAGAAERPLLAPDKLRAYHDFVAAGGQLSMFQANLMVGLFHLKEALQCRCD
jgi:para-nitrobenzyl esterase